MQSEAQQTDTVTIKSEKKESIPPNGHIPNDVGTDVGTEEGGKKGQKRSIFVKQRSLEAKIKKGVTFQGLDGDVPEEAVKGVKSEVHCQTRTIKTNPHLHGGMANGRVKGRRDIRFANGSVVDSEAIGGISSDISEGEEPTRGIENTVHSGKRRVPPCSPPHRLPLRICSTCGGRQNPVAAVLYTTTQGATSTTSAGSDSLSSSPANAFYPGKDSGGSLSPLNMQMEKYTTYKSMQLDKGVAAMIPPPYPNININNDQSLPSTQETEVFKLGRHPSTGKFMGAPFPHSNMDTSVTHATYTSPNTHTVAVSVIQEVGTHTHAALCSTLQKPTSVSHTAQAPRAPMLTLPTNSHKHSIVSTQAETYVPSDTSTHAKAPYMLHCNGTHPNPASTKPTYTYSKPLTFVQLHRQSDMNSILADTLEKSPRPKTCKLITTADKIKPITPKTTSQIHSNIHPKGISLTSQSNHADTHTEPSTTLHSLTSTEDQNLAQSHLTAVFKPLSTSHPNTDVKLLNGLEARQNTHPRSSISVANPSTKPQSLSQIHFSTDPKPSATSNSNYSRACSTSTYTQTHSVTSDTCLGTQTSHCTNPHTTTHSKPFSAAAPSDSPVSAHCTLLDVDMLSKPHSIFKNQSGLQCKLSHTSYTTSHSDAALDPCPVTTMSLLTQSNTAETTHAFVELHSNNMEQLKASHDGLGVAVQETNVMSITENLENRTGEASLVTTSLAKVTAEPLVDLKKRCKFIEDKGADIDASHKSSVNSESQGTHQKFVPTFCPRTCRPPKPSHAAPLHPAFELLIEVTRNRGTNAKSKPSPHLPSPYALSGSQTQNVHTLRDTESQPEIDSQASVVLPISGHIPNRQCAPTHIHPPSLALLLPTSLECDGNQDPQKRLEKVEANLHANQERIANLLNIIQDLEMSHAFSKG